MGDVEYVVSEVRDLLRAGRVGLYEFTEIQRSRRPDASVAELEPTSRDALAVILADPDVGLGVYRWTQPDYRTDSPRTVPETRDWQTPPEEEFLGVEYRQ